MVLLRVYAKMDSSKKIALSRGICKALDIKPEEKLELTIVGKKIQISKIRYQNGKLKPGFF